MRTLVRCPRCLDELMSGEEHEPARCLRRLRNMLHTAVRRVDELRKFVEEMVAENYIAGTPESTEAGR